MRPLIVFAVLVALLVLGLWLSGAFEGPATDPSPEKPPSSTDVEIENGETETGLRSSVVPEERPDLEQLTFPEGTRALLLARRKLPENLFTLQLLADATQVGYQSWFLNAGADAAAGSAARMPVLGTMPTAELLTDQSIDLLVLDNIDPNDLPDPFWTEVYERVSTGLMGLMVQGYPPYSVVDAKAKVHPLLEHPVTAKLIPIAEAMPLVGHATPAGGTAVPGVFVGTPRPFLTTDAGSAHPATRLSPWPEWSRAWWTVLGEGDDRIGALFCYPVTELKAGAKTLVTVSQKVGDDIPAIIVGPAAEGRVMWIGVPQLGWKFHYNNISKKRVGTLMHNLLAWLAGAKVETETE